MHSQRDKRSCVGQPNEAQSIILSNDFSSLNGSTSDEAIVQTTQAAGVETLLTPHVAISEIPEPVGPDGEGDGPVCVRGLVLPTWPVVWREDQKHDVHLDYRVGPGLVTSDSGVGMVSFEGKTTIC